MGKGWAKGLTAATDPRVAAAAAAHRGLQYRPRERGSDLRKLDLSRPAVTPQWTATMAYVVGLTATDGCLFTGRRAINFKSSDRQLVELYLRLLGRTNRVSTQRTKSGGIAFTTEFGDAALYRWFLSVGLTPRKSLTIGALEVPDAYLFPLLRGLLDGDGSVINKVYRADTGRRDDYYWEYLITKFCSASRAHIDWISTRISDATGLIGYAQTVAPKDDAHHPLSSLRYGKRASIILLPMLYPDGAPCLERKRATWRAYAVRHGIALG
jgi:hypothetical protein